MSELVRPVDRVNITKLDLRETLAFDESAVVVTAALAGGREAYGLFGKSTEELKIQLKANDGDTPVTLADRRSEDAMTGIIEKYFPDDSIYGEESKQILKNPDVWWIMDGVDGTSSFVMKQPGWSVGLARCEKIDGRIVPTDAMIVQPSLHRAVVARRGMGAYLLNINPEIGGIVRKPDRAKVDERDMLYGAHYIYDGLENQNNERKLEAMLYLLRDAVDPSDPEGKRRQLNHRATGSNLGAALEVAIGSAHFTVMDCVGGIQDILPGALIVQEAGGIYTDLFGNEMDMEFAKKTHLTIGSNKLLHAVIQPPIQYCLLNYQGFRMLMLQ